MRGVGVLAIVVLGCGRVDFDPTNDARDGVYDGAEPADPALVFWLRFDDSPADGVDNHAAGGAPAACVVACPTVVPAKRGAGYQFDGTSVIDLADSPAHHLAAATFAVWVRLDVDPRNSAASNTWEVLVGEDPVMILAGGDAGNPVSYASTPWPGPGTWRHVAMTWDASAVTLYLDGTLAAQDRDLVASYDSEPTIFGADRDNTTILNHLRGTLDDARLYSRVLSQPEIAALAAP